MLAPSKQARLDDTDLSSCGSSTIIMADSFDSSSAAEAFFSADEDSSQTARILDKEIGPPWFVNCMHALLCFQVACQWCTGKCLNT
jgi:hypothetical protein